MSVLLGGRAAEELVFGSITTGAADDLHRVAEISRSMVHDYAMGTSITSRKVSAEGGQVSDRTRQLRDEEQQHLADEALRGAMKLISDHRTKLDQLASALLRNEVLERKDIDRIMEGVPRFHRSPGAGPAGRRGGPHGPPAASDGDAPGSADDERVGRALDRHALEPALADLAVHVELGAARQLDLDDAARGGARPAPAARSCRGAGPRRGGRARAASRRAGRHVQHAVARVGHADLRAAAERAPGGDDQLPGAALEAGLAVDAHACSASGASVAAARSAPTP